MTASKAERDFHFLMEHSLWKETRALMCISFPTAIRFPGKKSIKLFDSKGDVFVVSVFLLIILFKNRWVLQLLSLKVCGLILILSKSSETTWCEPTKSNSEKLLGLGISRMMQE